MSDTLKWHADLECISAKFQNFFNYMLLNEYYYLKIIPNKKIRIFTSLVSIFPAHFEMHISLLSKAWLQAHGKHDKDESMYL